MFNKKLLLAAIIAAPFALSVTSCSNGNGGGKHTLNILNSEDYIYLNMPTDGYDKEDMVNQFIAHAKKKFGWNDITVSYNTSDTNESIYNDLLTGRIQYDLVCCSDYMVQKFVKEDLVTTLDTSLLPNYEEFASKSIKKKLDDISVQKDSGETVYLKDYSVGYMWGTLGLIINPTFNLLKERNPSFYDPETESWDALVEKVSYDAQSWDILWNQEYKKIASIKNSMRDTYAVALMHGYDKELEALKNQYYAGEIDAEEYNSKLSVIFNLRDEENTLPMVRRELDSLNKNIFGLEVDSGKNDIVEGKIGINLAWSGDAVFSMDRVDDNDNLDFELYYTVPENGSNIWLDAWAMPKNDTRDPDKILLAHEFLDFISTPEHATDNMDYTGYTSFIAGDSILELTRDWYDARCDLIYDLRIDEEENEDYRSIFYYGKDEDTEEDILIEVWFEDCFLPDDLDPEFDEVKLYSGHGEYDEEGNLVEVPDLEDLNETYNERLVIKDEYEWETVDLSYFFEGTLSEDYDESAYTFYSDCYLPFVYESDSGDEKYNISVGRQFFCQYPDEETITRCCVMEDYGNDNIKIIKLWEDFKSNPLPLWAIILIIVEVGLIVFGVGYFIFSKRIKKKLRVKRTQNNN